MGPKDIGNNSSSNNKKKEAEEQQQKRPGSAVSREFQPSSRQKAGPLWRKPTEANEQKQQQIYGSHYVPFKSAAASTPAASIYGTAIRPSNPPQQLQPNDYLHSIYAPPQLVRQNRQLQHPEPAIINHRGAVGAGVAQIHHQPPENINMAQNHHQQQQIGGSRPGSDLGIYKMMSSRCQSYTTLPRPEHGPPELLMEEMVPVAFTKSQPAQLYGTREGGVAITQIPFRPPSAASRSLGRKNSTTAGPLPPAYFGGPNIFAPGIADFGLSADYGRRDGHHTKELVPWGIVSLSSWLTIVFGTAIFCLGAVRLYWRADFAKGQELFYGISAICAGLVGFFASQNRSFSMFVAAFLLCCLNVVFIFVPFLSGILPLMPLLSSNGKPYISLGGTKEPVEVDIGLAVLSLMQLAAAFSLLLYGCRAFGTAMKHVEQLKMGLEHSAAMAATSPRVDSGGKI